MVPVGQKRDGTSGRCYDDAGVRMLCRRGEEGDKQTWHGLHAPADARTSLHVSAR